VPPGAVLRRWAAFLAVADEGDAGDTAAEGSGGAAEEAARRRLARRMGGMLVAFGGWVGPDD